MALVRKEREEEMERVSIIILINSFYVWQESVLKKEPCQIHIYKVPLRVIFQIKMWNFTFIPIKFYPIGFDLSVQNMLIFLSLTFT